MRKLAILAALAAFVSAPAFAASPLEGTWAVEAKSDFGTFKSTWTIAEKDGVMTVDVKDAPMEGFGDGAPPSGSVKNVKVEGNTLTFDRSLIFGDMAIDLANSVTVDGNTLSGTSKSGFGDTPLSGTRQ